MSNGLLPVFLASVAAYAGVHASAAPTFPETISPGAFRRSGFDTGIVKVAVPLEITSHGLIVRVAINGVPLRLGVDTGASRTVIFAAAAKRAGLKAVGPAPVRTPVGIVETAGLGLVGELRIGHARIRNEPVLILSQPPRGSDAIDGSLGIATLRDWDVRLDVPRRTMTLFPAGKADASPDEAAVRLYFLPPLRDKRNPDTRFRPAVAIIPVSIDGKMTPMLLDTGYGGTVSLPAALAERVQPGILAGASPAFGGSITPSGIMRERRAHLNVVTFWPDTFRSLPVMLETLPPGSPPGTRGTVGLGLLRHYVTTFRFSESRLDLRPLGTSGELTSGLTLGFNTSPGGEIVGVVPGGPADKAGLKPGDRVLAIDGETFGSKENASRVPASPGTPVRIRYSRDGGEPREVSALLEKE